MKFLTITTALALLATSLPAPAQVQFLEAWWIDMGETDSTGLGSNIANLGDINSDGLNDFLVGSQNEEAFVYLGNAQVDTTPHIIIPNPDSSAYFFGVYVFNIGDVNGDGGEDFIIHARLSENPLQHRIAYLYFGGDILDSIPDLVLDGPENYMSAFGFNGTGIGDFNGDGGNDFILIDLTYNWFTPDQGIGLIYLYFGGEILDSIPDWKIHGGNPFIEIGEDASTLGDVNDDGFDDFVMVDPGCEGPQGEEDMGVVAVYYGGTQPDTLPDIVIYGEEENAGLGRSVAGIDFDGDGQKDIVVGSNRDYPPSHQTSIYVYLVSPDMDNRPDFILPDEGYLGYTTGKGILGMDLNGDGWQDIVSCNPMNVFYAGKVYVYLGGANPDTLLDAYYFQGNLESSLGAGGCNAGDINGDGIEDLIVGEPGYNYFYTQNMWGRIHVIQGDTVIHQSVGIAQQEYLKGPTSHLLLEAHPNPFNAQTTIAFTLPVPSYVKLDVLDITGRAVGAQFIAPTLEGMQPSGTHHILFDGSDLPSGIYLARLEARPSLSGQARSYQATRKLVLMK